MLSWGIKPLFATRHGLEYCGCYFWNQQILSGNYCLTFSSSQCQWFTIVKYVLPNDSIIKECFSFKKKNQKKNVTDRWIQADGLQIANSKDLQALLRILWHLRLCPDVFWVSLKTVSPQPLCWTCCSARSSSQ